jgi:lycopene cyclase domain-containing protein
LTYIAFHAAFILPPIALLAAWLAPRRQRLPRRAGWALAAVALLAFAWTTPWDNYLVARGVWHYGADRVIGVIGYVPIEEYLFFALQPVLTGLAFYAALVSTMDRATAPASRTPTSRHPHIAAQQPPSTVVSPSAASVQPPVARYEALDRDEALPSPASAPRERRGNAPELVSTQRAKGPGEGAFSAAPALAVPHPYRAPARVTDAADAAVAADIATAAVAADAPPICPAARWVAAASWLAIAIVALLSLRGEEMTYLRLILAWAAPVLAGLWIWAGAEVWARRRVAMIGLALPTLYLWIADAIAIRLGIWSIDPRLSTGIVILGLPIEEAVFFLVTNLLVITGVIAILYRPAGAAARLPRPAAAS